MVKGSIVFWGESGREYTLYGSNRDSFLMFMWGRIVCILGGGCGVSREGGSYGEG